MTASLLFPIGSSKSKQSVQFDPARQVYTGKVWTCHERSNRTVGDCVYPAGELVGEVFLLDKQTLPGSAECSLTALGTDTTCSFQSQTHALCYSLVLFRKSFLGALTLSHCFSPVYALFTATPSCITGTPLRLPQNTILNSRHPPTSQSQSSYGLGTSSCCLHSPLREI